jgi:hypothetical protein
MSSLKDNIEQLPPDLKKEAEDFIEYLLYKKTKRKSGRLNQDWAGALRECRDQFTSTELEEKAKEWRQE